MRRMRSGFRRGGVCESRRRAWMSARCMRAITTSCCCFWSGARRTWTSRSTCGRRPSPRPWRARAGAAGAARTRAARRRYRGSTEAEAAAWLYSIAKNQLARYLRRGYAERRAMQKLGLERPPAGEELLADIWQRARLDASRAGRAAALATLREPVREAVRLRVVDE